MPGQPGPYWEGEKLVVPAIEKAPGGSSRKPTAVVDGVLKVAAVKVANHFDREEAPENGVGNSDERALGRVVVRVSGVP